MPLPAAMELCPCMKSYFIFSEILSSSIVESPLKRVWFSNICKSQTDDLSHCAGANVLANQAARSHHQYSTRFQYRLKAPMLPHNVIHTSQSLLAVYHEHPLSHGFSPPLYFSVSSIVYSASILLTIVVDELLVYASQTRSGNFEFVHWGISKRPAVQRLDETWCIERRYTGVR